MRDKRWRVTQYQQMSELGLVFFNSPANRNKREVVAHKDFRWLWRARLCAAINRGTSAGLGLRLFTTEIKDMHRIEAGGADGFMDDARGDWREGGREYGSYERG